MKTIPNDQLVYTLFKSCTLLFLPREDNSYLHGMYSLLDQLLYQPKTHSHAFYSMPNACCKLIPKYLRKIQQDKNVTHSISIRGHNSGKLSTLKTFHIKYFCLTTEYGLSWDSKHYGKMETQLISKIKLGHYNENLKINLIRLEKFWRHLFSSMRT